MSGNSSVTFCPICGNPDMSLYTDWKPYDIVDGTCLKCGFVITTVPSMMSLEDLNDLIEEENDMMEDNNKKQKVSEDQYEKYKKIYQNL